MFVCCLNWFRNNNVYHSVWEENRGKCKIWAYQRNNRWLVGSSKGLKTLVQQSWFCFWVIISHSDQSASIVELRQSWNWDCLTLFLFLRFNTLLLRLQIWDSIIEQRNIWFWLNIFSQFNNFIIFLFLSECVIWIQKAVNVTSNNAV